MRTLITLVTLACFCGQAYAQILDPVSWTFESKKVNDLEYDLVFKADIDKGWCIYSQHLSSKKGPVPTSFEFDLYGHFDLVGDAAELGSVEKSYDEIFGMELIKLKGEVSFVQRVKVKNPEKTIEGYLTFMTCDNERCLPPDDIEFIFRLNK